jgi:hypothetical protein
LSNLGLKTEDEMIRILSAAVFATSLLAGSLAFAAGTQTPATMPKPAATAPQATAENYPPCSRSLHDRCIEVNKLLNRAYPSCAKIKSPDEKASCAETAYKGKS